MVLQWTGSPKRFGKLFTFQLVIKQMLIIGSKWSRANEKTTVTINDDANTSILIVHTTSYSFLCQSSARWATNVLLSLPFDVHPKMYPCDNAGTDVSAHLKVRTFITFFFFWLGRSFLLQNYMHFYKYKKKLFGEYLKGKWLYAFKLSVEKIM